LAQDAPADAEQPEASAFALRHIGPPPPRHLEDAGDDVVGIIGRGTAPASEAPQIP
jgi:hypothetical protein